MKRIIIKVNRTKNSNPTTSERPANRKNEQTPNATLFIVYEKRV